MKNTSLIINLILLINGGVFSQNVGIGTSNPTAELHISSGTSSSVSQKLTSLGGEVILGFDLTNQGYFGTTTSSDLRLQTKGINRLNIGSNGNIGIGINTASEKLHLADGSFFISNLGSTNKEGILFGEATSPVYGWIYDGIGSGTNNQLHLREYLSETPTDLMTIKGNGRFGFGTSNPTQKIHVYDGSVLLSNLGETEGKGFLLGEASVPVYGWIYDGVGSGAGNTIRLREYIGTETDLMVINADGKVQLSDLSGTNRRVLYAESDGTIATGPETLYYSGTGQSSIENFFENIHLPDGAKLKSLNIRYRDDSNDSQLLFLVTKTANLTNSSPYIINSGSGTTFNSSVIQNKVINFSNSEPAVNNKDFNYSLEVFRQEPLFGAGSDLRFYTYRITYILE